MRPYAELFAFGQLSPIRKEGFTRFRDTFAVKDPEDFIEVSGRWDYGEKNALKLGQKSKVRYEEMTREGDGTPYLGTFEREVPIIQKYLSMGHESMIEISWAAFFIECSRVVSHEMVRHRLASYQQESQRFVKYDDETVESLFLDTEDPEMRAAYQVALDTYSSQRAKGVAPQIARYVFPNATRTRLIMATNVREWRHILSLRMDKSAQPEMQQVAHQIYDQLIEVYPNALHGILEGGRHVR